MNMKRLMVVGTFATAALLVGCAQPGLGGGNYTRGQVRGEQSVRLGTVECSLTRASKLPRVTLSSGASLSPPLGALSEGG